MRLIACFLTTLAALIGGPVLAQSTTSAQLSGQPQQVYLLPDGSYSPVSVPIATDGTPVSPATAANQTTSNGYLQTLASRSVADGTAVTVTPRTSTGDLLIADTFGGAPYLIVQLIPTWAGTVTFYGSNDGINYIATNCQRSDGNSVPNATTTIGVSCSGFRYIKISVTSYTSGTVDAKAWLRTVGFASTGAMSLGTSTANVGNVTLLTGSASYGGLAGVSVSGGWTQFRWVTGASGAIKASAGRRAGAECLNTTASIRYIQWYNKTTAGVPGTDTPVAFTPLTASSTSVTTDTVGVYHSTGISWAITTDAAGATLATSGDVVCSGRYQ